MPHGSSATYGSMAHNVVVLIVILTNLASSGCRGESCALLGVVSRVVARELLVWSPFVRRLEGLADKRPEAPQRQLWRSPVVLGSHSVGDDIAVPGVVAQW
jgi:hypothetical protein